MENKNNSPKNLYFDVPYYDNIFKNVAQKNTLFSTKGIYKVYNAKMTTQEKIFKDAKTIKHTIYIDLGVNKFNMTNTIFGVLNLRSYRECLLKQIPNLHVMLFKNRIQLTKKTTDFLVKVNQLVIGENLNDGSFIYIGTPNMTFTTINQLIKAYEQFMRNYYLNKRYDIKVHTIKTEILYIYGKTN